MQDIKYLTHLYARAMRMLVYMGGFLLCLLLPDTSHAQGVPKGTKWHWQIANQANVPAGATAVDSDLFNDTAKGQTSIAYFSAGTCENWRSDVNGCGGLPLGNGVDKVGGGQWAGERFWDVRSQAVRDIIIKRLDVAMRAIGSIQQRDMYRSWLRAESVMSVWLETELLDHADTVTSEVNNLSQKSDWVDLGN